MRVPLSPDVRNEVKPLLQLLHFAQKDLSFAMDLYQPWVRRVNRGESVDNQEFRFYAKTLTLTLLGLADALGFFLREIVVSQVNRGALEISQKDLAHLSEKRYDRESDRVTDEPVRFLSTKESFKLALKWFPLVFDEEADFKLNSVGWQSFGKLVEDRNEFVHPKRLEHLASLETFAYLQSATLWFLEAASDLFTIASRAAGNPPRQRPETPEVRVETSILVKPTDVFDAEFYDLVEQCLGRSIGYAKEMMSRLGKDTSRSYGLLQDAYSRARAEDFVDRPLHSDERIQFATRNYLRFLFVELEGTVAYIKFLLEGAARRGEITVTDEELALLDESVPLDERLWSATDLWARELGEGPIVGRSKENWEIIRKAVKWRNKVVHPQEVFDYVLLPTIVDSIVFKLPSWYLHEVLGVLEIAVDKVAGSGS